jgi:MFS family permease
VAAAFVANGLGGPSFLARLPERQADLGVSDATLGLTLVGMAAGAMVVSPAVGRWVSRVGSRRVLLAASVGLGASLWTAGAAPSALSLFLALALVGAADAAMDISMNANGAAFEDWSRRSVMHRLHGAWSLGALAGAGIAAASAAAGLPLTAHLAGMGALIAAGVVIAGSGLVRDDAVAPAHGIARPLPRPPSPDARERAGADPAPGSAPAAGRRLRVRRVRPIVVLAAATVAGAVIEGGPSDWSAVQLERLGVATGVSALAYAAFMAGMVVGRFSGDRLTDRFGGATVLRGGMLLLAAGVLGGVVSAHPAAFAIGLVLAGLGAAAFFPLAFSAAARTPGVSPGSGAATVSLAARLGFLVEPVLIGAVAQLVGLRWAFGMVAALALALAAAARVVIPEACRPTAAPLVDVREP